MMSSSWNGMMNEIAKEDCISCSLNQWIQLEFPSRCYCGAMLRMWEARKDGTKHLGRRFFGCINFRDKKTYSSFFKWYDPPFSDRARDVIEDLILKLKVSRKMVDKLKNEKSEKAKNWLATEMAESSVKTLDKEIKKLKKMNTKLVGREKIY